MEQVVFWLKQIFSALKERNESSMPLNVTDITAIANAQLDALKPGDVVVKQTGNQLHTYTVSYKGNGSGEGICLTYVDAGLIETVSYDRTASGWEYNSTDKCTIDVDE